MRGAATVGGNVVLARQHALQSDYGTIMIAAGAEVEVVSKRGARYAQANFANQSGRVACKTIMQLACARMHMMKQYQPSSLCKGYHEQSCSALASWAQQERF